MDLKSYKRFIFDFDGVIADSNSIKEDAIRKAASKVDNPVLREDFVDFFINNNGLTREFKVFKFFDSKQGNFILKNYSEILEKTFYDCPLIEGVENFLLTLKKLEKNLVVLSGGSQKEVRKFLVKSDLINNFDSVLGGPESKKNNYKKLKFERKTLFFGDSKLDYDLAKEFNLDFVFVYGATAMKRWKTELHFPDNFSFIKNFGEFKNV